MAIRPWDRYGSKAGSPSPEYPLGSCINSTSSGAKDGTPGEKDWMNDIWGMLQVLLTKADIVASGSPDNVLTSQYLAALQRLFMGPATYADSGTADNYILNPISGATVDEYSDGMIAVFRPLNANTGPAVVQIGSLALKPVVYDNGLPLAASALLTNRHAILVYEQSNNRFVLIGIEPSVANGFDTTIYGLAPSNFGGDIVNDLIFGAGMATAISDPSIKLVLPVAMRKRKDEFWAEGDGNGGTLDASVPLNHAHCFIIRRDSDGYVDAGFSSSLTPTLPTGYTHYRRIASFGFNPPSTGFAEFYAQEFAGGALRIQYIASQELPQGFISGFIDVPGGPPDVAPIGHFALWGQATATSYFYLTVSGGSGPASATRCTLVLTGGDPKSTYVEIPIATDQTLQGYLTGGPVTVEHIFLLGYTDRRVN